MAVDIEHVDPALFNDLVGRNQGHFQLVALLRHVVVADRGGCGGWDESEGIVSGRGGIGRAAGKFEPAVNLREQNGVVGKFFIGGANGREIADQSNMSSKAT